MGRLIWDVAGEVETDIFSLHGVVLGVSTLWDFFRFPMNQSAPKLNSLVILFGSSLANPQASKPYCFNTRPTSRTGSQASTKKLTLTPSPDKLEALLLMEATAGQQPSGSDKEENIILAARGCAIGG